MSTPISGQGGTGEVLLHTFGQGGPVRLELVTFTIVTDATVGVHTCRLLLIDPGAGVIYRGDDLNEAPPSSTIFYTYGIGLIPSACTLTAGMAARDDLPDTKLQPGTSVELHCINGAGVTIANDQVQDVVLFASGGGAQAGGEAPLPLIQPYEQAA